MFFIREKTTYLLKYIIQAMAEAMPVATNAGGFRKHDNSSTDHANPPTDGNLYKYWLHDGKLIRTK